MSVCWQHCGSANWRYTTVGISWHLGERPTADREIISTGAAAQWELSTAAVMLRGEHGLQGLVGETFTDIEKNDSAKYIIVFYSLSTHCHTTRHWEVERAAIKGLVKWYAGMQRWWLRSHGHLSLLHGLASLMSNAQCGDMKKKKVGGGTKAWKGQNLSVCVCHCSIAFLLSLENVGGIIFSSIAVSFNTSN